MACGGGSSESEPSLGFSSDDESAPGATMRVVPCYVAVWNQVQGLYHFLCRPSLWAKVVCPIFVTLVTTIVSLWVFFRYARKPQEDFLIGHGLSEWLAWFTVLIMTFAEVAIVNLIVMLVLFAQTQSAILRAVLEERGVLKLLRSRPGKETLPEQNCLRDVGHTIRFLSARVPLLIITLPLNAVPVAGNIAWCILNGWLYTWELEAEFMVMVEELYSCNEQLQVVKQQCVGFSAFGAIAVGLELLPFVGPWIFFATNACGAAFLAEEMIKDYPPMMQLRISAGLPGGSVASDDASVSG